jgi:AcrR family transcriptional regulator
MAVHTAVREMLAEQGGDGLTIQAVADRAGVHSTTLYRRWGSTADLLADVAASRFSGADGRVLVPDTGDLRSDLRVWTAAVAADLADPDVLALIRAAVGSGEDAGCRCIGDRVDQLDAILDREHERGGERLDVDHVVDVLLAPLYFRAMFTRTPATPEWARSLVDTLD